MKKTITAFLMMIGVIANAQPTLNFSNTYGGASDEHAYDLIQNMEGNFVMVGSTQSYGSGGSDIYLVIADQNGNEIASYVYGGADNENATSVKQTADGGYIIAGNSATLAAPNNDYEMYVLKVDDQGVKQWEMTYGGGSASCINLTDDGGYIIAGSQLIKTDEFGNMTWSRDLIGGSVIQTSDGSFVNLGNPQFDNLVLTKLDNSGGVLWTQIYGVTGFYHGANVIETTDGGFIIGATTSTYGAGELDAYLVKTDSEGNQLWTETYGDIYHDQCESVKQTIDGGYILAGLKQVNNLDNNDVWVIKTDAVGTIQWDWSIDNPGTNWAESVIQTHDNGYAVAGMTFAEGAAEKDFYLLSFAPDDLTAWFYGEPTVISSGEYVNFTEASLGNATTWFWDFGNGETFSGQNPPAVQYNTNGTYDVSLTVDNGVSLTRTAYISVEDIINPSYCESYGLADRDWIRNVELNNQSNSSGGVGYEDYTNIVFNLEAGSSYTINLSPGSAPGKKLKKNWRVWIDFNMDGSFDGEEVFAADGEKGDVSGNIYIPGSFEGDTRMRISMSTDGVPFSCDQAFNGEVEDYTVSVEPQTPQPPIADFSADLLNVAAGQSVFFTDLTQNDPNTWNWEFSGDNGIVLTSTVQNPEVIFNETGVYTVTLTAENDYGSDTEVKTDYIVVSADPPANQYCEPTAVEASSWYHIREVSIGGVLHTANSSQGYTFYSEVTFELLKGEDCAVILTPSNNRTRSFWRIWVDLDGNGSFEDEGELLFSANNKKGEVSGSMNIPINPAATEMTRMRITMKKEAAPANSCDDGFTGQVRDYNVIFVDPFKESETVPPNEAIQTRLYPNPVCRDNLHIELRMERSRISIFNQVGQLMDEFIAADKKISIDLSGYKSGIYFVRIQNKESVESLMFIKK